MDISFYEDLVGKKFPTPTSSTSSGLGDSQESSTSDNLSPKYLEPSTANSVPGTLFRNHVPTSSRNASPGTFGALEKEVLPWNSTMEDRMTLFNLPLASADTHLQNTVFKRCGLGLTVLKEVERPITPSTENWHWNWNPCMSQISLSAQVQQQLKSDKPARDYFRFSPTLTHIAEKPFFSLFCHRSYNLVKTVVYFTIQVHNLPRGMKLDAKMFAALVATPEGKYEPCYVHEVDNFMVNSFSGSFWAENDGDYMVMVGILIPKEFWSQVNNASEDQGFVSGTLDIPVSRNYAGDCQMECLFIDCEYKTETLKARRAGPGPRPHQRRPWAATTQHRNFQQGSECKLYGLTADQQSNNLFYTDRVSNEVICVHPSGQTLLRFGQQGPSKAKFYRPTGIAHDDVYGRLIIADKDNHRICFFTMDGQYISSFGSLGHENGQLHYPWDVAVYPDGQNIVVSDSRNKRVQLFDRFGNFLNKYSVFETNPFVYKNELCYPRGITFDETGKNIYVADFNGHNVVRIPIDFTHHRKMIPEGKLRRPQGLAVDWCGNLLIADSRNNCIRHVSPQSDLISNISRVLDQPLDFPVNVTTLAGGFVAVLCSNGRICIF